MNKLIATNGAAVTPSDTENLTTPGTLFIGVSGDVQVIHMDDTTDTPIIYKNVPVGFFPVGVRRVRAAGTTATNIIVNF